MPIYTYGPCPRGHDPFDKRVPMSEMDEDQPCEGQMAKPECFDGLKAILTSAERPDVAKAALTEKDFYAVLERDRMPKLIQCGIPVKRREVPSSPANFIMR